MTSFQKAIEIDLMEFNKDMALMEDVDYIALIEGDYYRESGDSKENIFEKAIRHVRDLIRKIKDKIAEKFSDEKVKKQQEKIKMKIMSDPTKKNKKVKVRVNDKVYALDKKALDDLTKCKTKEEVEKYMADYRKKREKLVAGSIVVVSAATAIGILGSKLHKTHKQLDELQGEYEKSIKALEKKTDAFNSLKNHRKLEVEELTSERKQNELLRDAVYNLRKENKKLEFSKKNVEAHVKGMKESQNRVRNGLKDIEKTLGKNTKLIPEYRKEIHDKGTSLNKNGNSDESIQYIKRLDNYLDQAIIKGMNDIINRSINLESELIKWDQK